jgi:hypothetical protein
LKLIPERTLATQARSDGKKSKDRITLAFSVSASEKKQQVWCIGKSKNPRCFKNINRKLLRIEYLNNKSKWITGRIMEEYLHWLDNKIRAEGRKVLLLLDNFSGHELGVSLVRGLEGQSESNSFYQILRHICSLLIKGLLRALSFNIIDCRLLICFDSTR